MVRDGQSDNQDVGLQLGQQHSYYLCGLAVLTVTLRWVAIN